MRESECQRVQISGSGLTAQGAASLAQAGISANLLDKELLADLTAGKAEAFWCLWIRHEAALRQVCLREMDGHRADAEDALSQVMLKAQDRLPACAGDIIHLEAWLRQLARNLCLDLRRQSQRRVAAAESWVNDPLAEDQCEPPPPPVEAESDIHQWIAALPPPLREPFKLHVVLEIPAKEVAAKLGLTPANVRKRVQLARGQLRRDLGGRRQGHGDRVRPTFASQPAARIEPARPPAARWELFAAAAVLRTVRVKRSCGVEELFHAFAAKAPFALGRKMKNLQRQVLQHPDHWPARLELADSLYLAGQWELAVAEWQSVLARHRSLPSVLKLGDTLLKLGGIKAATGLFQAARRQDFQSAATGRHLAGWLACCQQDAARSVLEFAAAAELEPENPVHWHGLALACQRQGNPPAALAALQHALRLNPDDLAALSLGHEMLLAAGDLEEAVRRARHLLTLAPLDLLTLRRLVDCRCQLGLTQGTAGRETMQWLRCAQRQSVDSLVLRETLASFFLAQGNLRKALAISRDLFAAHPQCAHHRQFHERLLRASGLPVLQPAEPDVRKLAAAKFSNDVCQMCVRSLFPGSP